MVHSVVLYTSALCNLKCDYCFISKNKGLSIADKALAKSFEDPNYYFNLYSKCVKPYEYADLQEIEIFGSEPLLFGERAVPTVRTFLKNCPKLQTIFIYTNLSHEKVVPSIKAFMDCLAEFAPRRFNVHIQFSMDGPEDLTDTQRSKGLTKLILKYFNELLDVKFYNQPNICTIVHAKPTISYNNLSKFLDKDYIKYYYTYMYNNIFKKIIDLNDPHILCNDRYQINLTVPYDATREEGLLLAKVLHTLNEVDIETEGQPEFDYFGPLNWHYRDMPDGYDRSQDEKFCPFGRSVLSLLPDGQYCACKRSFANFCDTYINDFDLDLFSKDHILESGAQQDFLYKNVQEWKSFGDRLDSFLSRHPDDAAIINYYTHIIMQLAKTEQILPKYTDANEAKKAAIMISLLESLCAYHNIIDFGNEMFTRMGYFKEWLNGAADEVNETIRLLNEGKITDKWKRNWHM